MRVSNSIAQLRQQIHDDLRIQHPEWIEPNGDCPECDFYEARLMEELDTLKGSDESIAAIHRRKQVKCFGEVSEHDYHETSCTE